MPSRTSAHSQTFTIEGQLHGETVCVSWLQPGKVIESATVVAAARRIVQSGATAELDGRIIEATFANRQGAIVALTRAVDAVTAAGVGFGPRRGELAAHPAPSRRRGGSRRCSLPCGGYANVGISGIMPGSAFWGVRRR
jgi:hypothetical protein